jgi:ElaB/YqjD/DUF883 family membrane-anchored ribosome-binding protein
MNPAQKQFPTHVSELPNEGIETGQLREEESIPAWQKQTVEAAAQAAEATDTYIRQHPWQVIAWAAGAGFMLGLLLLRRRD